PKCRSSCKGRHHYHHHLWLQQPQLLLVKAFFVRCAVVGDVSLLSKILAALATGVIAIVVANPTDLVKVRLQADGKANTVKRSYSGALNVYATIIRHVTLTIMGKDGILAIVKQDERPLELLAKEYAINSFDIDPQNPSDVVFTLEWESIVVPLQRTVVEDSIIRRQQRGQFWSLRRQRGTSFGDRGKAFCHEPMTRIRSRRKRT
ncbi:hypothetical protein ACJX0J_036023, partial [Zea mays]